MNTTVKDAPQLIALGMSHNSAPVELREAVNVAERDLPAALERLASIDAVREGVLLSTCNRTELYCAIDQNADRATVEETLASYISSLRGRPAVDLADHLYHFNGGAAARHLMDVTSGLDSLVLGEYQILAQVKTAYAASRAARMVGTVLNTLFQNALAAAKKVRTETGIGRGTFSIGSAAVELARQIFGESLAGRTVLLLGAGKMSDLTARHLREQGAAAILVANRTYERAAHLASELGEGASARRFDDLPALLTSSDIVICSTAAPHPVVTRALLETSLKARRNRPLFLIDIAVPRDVESAAAELDNVYLFNIDDLKQVVESSRLERAREVEKAAAIIEEALAEYLSWSKSLELAPLIVAVRSRIKALGGDEALAGKLAHAATIAIKECADLPSDEAALRLDAIRRAYGIEADESKESRV